MTDSADPFAALRSRRYAAPLLFAAALGVVVAAAAYWFLKLITGIQKVVFSDVPHRLGFHSEPIW